MSLEDPNLVPPSDAASRYLARARGDVIRGSLWTAVNTVFVTPVAFAASILIARALGPSGAGQFATYTAGIAVAASLINLGFGEATVQWLAAAGAREEQDEAADLISRNVGWHIIVMGPLCALVVFLLLASSGVVLAALGAAAMLVTQLLGTATIILTAGARNANAARFAIVTSLLAQCATVVVAAATHDPAAVWTTQLLALVSAPLLPLMSLRPFERLAMLRPRFDRPPPGFIAYGLSACAASLVATLVFGRSEIFVLRLHDLVATIGIFSIVTGLASQLTSPLDSVLAPLAPTAAGLVAVDRQAARRALLRGLRVSALLGGIAASTLIPLGVFLIEPLYGHRFAGAAAPLVVLGTVSCTQTLLVPVTAFAFATRSAGAVLRVNLVCLAADAALALILIPFTGIWGATIANSVAQLTSLVLVSRVALDRMEVSARQAAAQCSIFLAAVLIGLPCSIFLKVSDLDPAATATVLIGAPLAMGLTMRALPVVRLRDDDVRFVLDSGPRRLRPIISGLLRLRLVGGRG